MWFKTTFAVALVLKFLSLPICQTVLAGQADNILIRNVLLIDPTANTEDREVNILIRDQKLNLISEDKISSKEAGLTLDGDNGVIIGKLEIDENPNFMILKEDPRVNFQTLLDTKKYAVFAMHEGKIVKSLLKEEPADDPDEPVKSSWLAYTPPPLAVPLNYHDTSQWNRWDTKYISGLFTGGFGLDRVRWISQQGDSESMFGDLGDDYGGGEVRGLRFGAVGTLNFTTPWVYTLFIQTNAFDKGFEEEDKDDFSIVDYRLDIPIFKNLVMSIGKQKEPISLERLQALAFIPMQERAVATDALMTSRNVGVVFSENISSNNWGWAIGAFNNWFDANQDFAESDSQITGRVTWTPFSSDDSSNVVHLGLGYRYSDAKEGFRYRSTPEIHKSPLFVDTAFGFESGSLPADRTDTWNMEFSWRKGPFWLASEYIQTYVDSSEYADPAFNGYYLTASWVLTGEMRPYNKKRGVFGRIPVSKTVYQGGKGVWEVAARYSDVDLTDGLVDGGETQIASLGLNWWLTPFFQMGINYRHIENNQGGLEGSEDVMNYRAILLLE